MYSSMGVAAQVAVDEGLTFQKVLESVPLDPLSLFAMGLMTVAVCVVVYFGLKSNAPDPSRPFRPAVAGEEGEPTTGVTPALISPVGADAAAGVAGTGTAPVAPGEPAPVLVQEVVSLPARPTAGPIQVPLGALAGTGAPGR